MIDLSKCTERKEVIDAVVLGVCSKYLARDRHYHDFRHILDLNQKLDEYCESEGKDFKFDEVKLAVALHDVVYDLPSVGPSNEVKSALLFRKYVLRLIPSLANHIDVPLVIDLIESTEHFNPDMAVTEKDDLEFLLLHDLDFSPLGGTPQQFKRDSENIRKEHWYISEEEFVVNRAKFLQAMLSKNSIYFLPYFQDKYEEQARKNLTHALEELEG